MRHLFMASGLGALCLAGAQLGLAQTGSVTITQPQEGARLDALAEQQLVYDVTPGPRGHHVHLYMDGKELAILRQLKGTYTLAKMSPGSHNICVKVVDRAHTPVGVERCVNVSVQ